MGVNDARSANRNIRCMRAIPVILALSALWLSSNIGWSSEITTPFLDFRLSPLDGTYEIHDKKAGVTWRAGSGRFGEVTLVLSGKTQRHPLSNPVVRQSTNSVSLEFKPLPNEGAIRLEVRLLEDRTTLQFTYAADPSLSVESLRLLDGCLQATGAGYAIVPVREGLLVPANSGLDFTHTFDTYAYEGCHMQMLGIVQSGAAALLTWDDPYVTAELHSATTNTGTADRKQALTASIVLRKSARSFRLKVLGKGDYVTIGKAYREIARERGWLVSWDQKLQENPERAKYFGASNYKLWSVLDRRMNPESTTEESVRVNWTFEEAAQVAEHLKHDLKLDKVLFMMGGWIHRGYDNQHPDILPTAPECGGDEAFREACKRIKDLGYILSLHDNYQDIYRDSPSWDERWIQKNPNGSLARGGSWAGGTAYLTCSKMALELAQRPQNLRAVKALSGANSYFIDTTYAAGLQECFDKEHPLTRADDLHWKQALSDYARQVFGSFGSECGREWAIPHADFFEGLTGVSGGYYHNKDLVKKLGATVIPLFEIVYRDCIGLYGKYGYDPAQAAEYVLHHIAIGRPLHYHNVPAHLYWKEPSHGPDILAMKPALGELQQSGPRQFSATYQWQVEEPTTNDWRVFVHFTDVAGNIKFQNDYLPTPAVSRWVVGERKDGPFEVKVPGELNGTFNVRMGLFQAGSGARARLLGRDNGERSYLVGRIKVTGDSVEYEPVTIPQTRTAGDPALYTRGEGGWTDGLHVMDRFVKNTHEILSPLNEITSRVPLTHHSFLTADRKVQRSVFGEGDEHVVVVVNGGATEFKYELATGNSATLPPLGFVVQSPRFSAFCATSWNGHQYSQPTLFTLRSLDQMPLSDSKRIRVFHAFGDAEIKVRGKVETIPKERVVEMN